MSWSTARIKKGRSAILALSTRRGGGSGVLWTPRMRPARLRRALQPLASGGGIAARRRDYGGYLNNINTLKDRAHIAPARQTLVFCPTSDQASGIGHGMNPVGRIRSLSPFRSGSCWGRGVGPTSPTSPLLWSHAVRPPTRPGIPPRHRSVVAMCPLAMHHMKGVSLE